MNRIVSSVGIVMLTMLSALLIYMSWWAVWYRLPSASEVIDMRPTRTESPFYITFCASLASNPHGFPGHAYVVWRTDPSTDILQAAAYGYVPLNPGDQIRSLYSSVPGLLVPRASQNNMRSLETLTVIVDSKTFERTRHLGETWNARDFKAGSRDCVSFIDFVAKDVGLATFRPNFEYPRDHIRRLKLLNRFRIQQEATAYRL